MSEKVFKLYANCIPVSGARRSAICDIQRDNLEFIPNKLYEILIQHKNESINKIKSYYDDEYGDVIDSYFDHLIEKDLGFWCKNPEEFPDIDLVWEHPSIITNAILDVNRNSSHDFKQLSNDLDQLGCQALQIRFYDELTVSKLKSMLNHFNVSRLRSIELVVKYSPEIADNLSTICQKNARIKEIIIHSSPNNNIFLVPGIQTRIRNINKVIKDNTCCGIVDPKYFTINISSFSESINFNSCLNKKLGIDVEGNIKNCPSMTKAFGNIKTTSLMEAIELNGFRKYWNITKDQIDVCKDCEFRYICVDCRAFTQNGNDYGKPEKCNYDPYIAKFNNIKSAE